MKPNCLHRNPIYTVLVWCLLALWLAGSVQASVHGVVMAGPESQVELATTPVAQLHHGHDALGQSPDVPVDSAHAGSNHADAPCVELCLMLSLTPAPYAVSMAGELPAHFAEPLGAPAGLAQPAVPPPRFPL